MSDTTLSTTQTTPTKVPSLFKAVGVVAIVTVVSKLLGLVRDQMIAHAYGASMVSDAYLYAFQIPSFSLVLLGGLGGPFHTATVSVLSKLIHGDAPPSDSAKRILNTFITLTAVVFTLLSVVCFFFAPQVIDLIAHQASPDLKALAAQQLQWMTPMILIGGLIGIFYGVANVYHQFLWPSLSPSAINVTLIAWLLAWGPDPMGNALAISTLLGGILQLGLQLPDFFKAGFSLWPAWDLKSPELKTMGELLFPATIGTTIGQLNIYVAMFFISQLPPGGWTATMLGNRLIQLPIGVLTIAMLVPLFPRFSRWVAEGDLETLKTSFKDGILSLWLVSFPIMALIFLVGQQGVSVLFERGAFDHRATVEVSVVLMVLSLSILPYMLRDGVTRVFYAFNDSKTPLIAGLASIAINFFLNMALIRYGVGGVAFSTVVVTLWNALILSLLVRKHIPDLGIQSFFAPAGQMLVGTLLASGAALLALDGLGWVFTHGLLVPKVLQSLCEILAVMGVLAGVYGGLMIYWKNPLAQRLWARVTSKLPR